MLDRHRWAEALARPALDPRQRVLCSSLALTVVARWDELEGVFAFALETAIEVDVLREILLESHLFAGFPKCLGAFEALARRLDPATPLPAWIEAMPPTRSRGQAHFEKIYGAQADRVLEAVRRHHPDLATWILEEAYGKVLSRPFLSAKERELAAVSALTLSRVPAQLGSHLRGARRAGASEDEVREAIQQVRVHGYATEADEAVDIATRLDAS